MNWVSADEENTSNGGTDGETSDPVGLSQRRVGPRENEAKDRLKDEAQNHGLLGTEALNDKDCAEERS